MKVLALLLLLIAAPALAQTGTTQPSSAPPTGPTPPPGLDVAYACPGGPDFSAHFTSDGDLATLRMPGEPDIELPRQNTNTGFLYTDGYYELRGRAREATLTAAGRSIRCHAAGRPGEPPRTFTGANSTLTLFPDGTFRLREKRDGVAEPVLDLGQWAQEVDGGARLVMRGSDNSRRAFREVGAGKLIDDKGAELTLATTPDLISVIEALSSSVAAATDCTLLKACSEAVATIDAWPFVCSVLPAIDCAEDCNSTEAPETWLTTAWTELSKLSASESMDWRFSARARSSCAAASRANHSMRRSSTNTCT